MTTDLRALGQDLVDQANALDTVNAALSATQAELAAAQATGVEDASEIADLKSQVAALILQVADLQDQLAAAVKPYPMVVSPEANSGETWAQAALRCLGYGFNGVVRYFGVGVAPSWDKQVQALAAAHPGALTLQVTAKTHSDAGLAAILKAAPATWTVIYNIFQEPEDNLLTPAQQGDYRSDYTSAAVVCRAAGAGLPWVEWQEWTLNPKNTNKWNLANFTPPASDFAGVLWSLFDTNEQDHINDQVNRIVAAMGKYAPGKPWALMASGMPLHPTGGPWTAAQQAAQAAWLTKCYQLTKAAGSVGWGYFAVNDSGQNHVEANPAAMAALQTLA